MRDKMAVLPATMQLNFGSLDDRLSSFRTANFVVLPVPYDLTASYGSGMRNGPLAIIEASMHMELYDEELRTNTYKAGIHTLPLLEPTTLGPDEMIHRVYKASEYIIKAKKTPVMIGGEHSITLGMARALKKIYPNLSVLQFDAHADMRDSYQDNPFNHACIARRLSEICPVVQVGIRSLSDEEAKFLKQRSEAGSRKQGLRAKRPGDTSYCLVITYYASDMQNGFSAEDICSRLTNEVFITIDLDVFDPSIMPATGTPEPGGMGWYDVLGILKTVASRKKVVGFDVVELSPIPGNIAPNFLAAKLVYRIMGYIQKNQKAKGKSKK